jgi:hypothetical protein
MIWTGWNNGKNHRTGAGYGLVVSADDRNRYFQRTWRTVLIELPGRKNEIVAEANVNKESFWGPQCRELITKDIGQWMLSEGHAPWPSSDPPKFEVEAIGERRFRVMKKLFS